MSHWLRAAWMGCARRALVMFCVSVCACVRVFYPFLVPVYYLTENRNSHCQVDGLHFNTYIHTYILKFETKKLEAPIK